MFLGGMFGSLLKRVNKVLGTKPDFNEPVYEVPINLPKNKYAALLRSLIPFKTSVRMSERIVEYPFVLSNLNLPIGSKILEVGSCRSMIALQLSSLGYKVTACDLKYYKYKHPNLKVYQGDLRNLDLLQNSYDAVIAISTIEHSGMGAYRDSISRNGDRQVVDKIHSVLKPKGIFLLTVPYGKKRNTPEERIYDKARLALLLKRFKILKSNYYKGINRQYWVPVKANDLMHIGDEKKSFVEGVSCVLAQKSK